MLRCISCDRVLLEEKLQDNNQCQKIFHYLESISRCLQYHRLSKNIQRICARLQQILIYRANLSSTNAQWPECFMDVLVRPLEACWVWWHSSPNTSPQASHILTLLPSCIRSAGFQLLIFSPLPRHPCLRGHELFCPLAHVFLLHGNIDRNQITETSFNDANHAPNSSDGQWIASHDFVLLFLWLIYWPTWSLHSFLVSCSLYLIPWIVLIVLHQIIPQTD